MTTLAPPTRHKGGALELLKTARQVLIDNGWRQGNYQGFDEEKQCDTYCAVGALGFGLSQTDTDDNAYSVAYWALNHQLPNEWVTVPRWNDHLGRTVEEVIALYDAAIAEVEAL